MLAIDHIVLPVRDLALAATKIETRYGLISVDGGRHPAWGTANRIIPLGETYVELVAVADPETATQTAFGTWVAAATPGQPLGWAVRTDSIESVGRRLGLPIVPGLRAAPGGALITWRSVGLDVATREPGLPFFIQRADGVAFPGAMPVRHQGGPVRLKRLSLTEDPKRLADWLGDHDLALSVSGGPSRVAAVILARGPRDFELQVSGARADHVRTVT
jgi:Glyoxalase-like domain